MDLDPAALAESEEAFIGAGLLCPARESPPASGSNVMNGRLGR